MALHHLTKKVAVEKYSPLVTEGKTEAEIKAAIAADEKGFDEAAVEEIYAALDIPTVEPAEENPNALKKYELWNVRVSYKTILNDNMDKEIVVDKIERKGDGPIMTTTIEARHAAILNAQVDNRENPNKQYYFLTEK